MALPPEIKKLITEDFSKDDQELVDKLAFVLNPFFEQMAFILTKNVNFDNLAQELKEIVVTTDLTPGVNINTPKQILQLRTSLSDKVKGLICVRAQNITNPNEAVVSTPFLNFVPNGQVLTISHVTGLPASSGDPNTSQTFRLTVLIIT